MGDEEGKRRLEAATEKITHHIVDQHERAKEGETEEPQGERDLKRPRTGQSASAPATPPATVTQEETHTKRDMNDLLVKRLKAEAARRAPKRSADGPAEDPRAHNGEAAEVVRDVPPAVPGAPDEDMRDGEDAARSSNKRAAEDEADDGHRGDDHEAMVDNVEHTCRHCNKRFKSCSRMSTHLCSLHDDDGEAEYLRMQRDEMPPRRECKPGGL